MDIRDLYNKDYTGKKFAVGIGYDKKLKKHCVKFEDI